MKTGFLIIVFGFVIVASSVLLGTASALPPSDYNHAFNHAEHVLVGEIVLSEIVSLPRNIPDGEHAGTALYSIQVDAYLKNPLDEKIIQVPGYFVDTQEPKSVFNILFEPGQKVILYLQEDVHSVLPNHELIIRDRESKVIVGDMLEFLDSVESPIDLVMIYQTENLLALSPPLKQIKSGIALSDVKCKEGKHPAYKYDRMLVACVTSSTYGDLIERGWAVLRLETRTTSDVGQNLCAWYGGDWDRTSRHCNGLESNLMCTMAGGNVLDDDCFIPNTLD